MNPLLSFASGIIAAFTPCVIVLIPLVLYRFFNKEKRNFLAFSLFISGFLISYLIFGVFLTRIFTSAVQNGFKIGLGILFTIIGILAFFNRLNPLNMPIVKNPFLVGMVFALVISFSPCTIPYISLIFSLNSSAEIFLNLLMFGFGLLIPSELLAVLGQSVIRISRKGSKILHTLDKMMSILLIITGIYLAISIKSLGIYDIYVVGLILGIVFAIIIKAMFLINSRREIFELKNLLMILALILIITATGLHCKTTVNKSTKVSIFNFVNHEILPEQACKAETIRDCPVCRQCLSIFSLATGLGLFGILLNYCSRKRSSFFRKRQRRKRSR